MGNQEWTIQRKQKGQLGMDNPEKTEEAIRNGQSRETDNIGYPRHRTKTNKARTTIQKSRKDEQHGTHQKRWE